jgi:hypothetical protein
MVHWIKLNQPQSCPQNFLLDRRQNSVGSSLHLTGMSFCIFPEFCTRFCTLKDTDLKFYLRGQEKRWQKYLKFILAIQEVYSVLVGKIPRWLNFTKRNRFEAILLVRDQHGHQTGKKTVKSRTKRKSKMWRCSILYEVQFFLIVPVIKTRQRKLSNAFK